MNSQTQPKLPEAKHQEIVLRDRAYLKINGVEDVSSFDETGIILKSIFGPISIDGTDLHITRLSVETGELEVNGVIGGVFFFEPAEQQKKRGLFGRR
jgi:sporulation protein YabP